MHDFQSLAGLPLEEQETHVADWLQDEKVWVDTVQAWQEFGLSEPAGLSDKDSLTALQRVLSAGERLFQKRSGLTYVRGRQPTDDPTSAPHEFIARNLDLVHLATVAIQTHRAEQNN